MRRAILHGQDAEEGTHQRDGNDEQNELGGRPLFVAQQLVK